MNSPVRFHVGFRDGQGVVLVGDDAFYFWNNLEVPVSIIYLKNIGGLLLLT